MFHPFLVDAVRFKTEKLP